MASRLAEDGRWDFVVPSVFSEDVTKCMVADYECGLRMQITDVDYGCGLRMRIMDADYGCGLPMWITIIGSL